MEDAAERLAAVNSAIERACMRAGRKPESVTLIAVSKGHPVDAIEQLIDAGHRHFGESRVQEAQAKWPDLKVRHPDLRLHFIGRLQSNKAAETVILSDAIHSVDRRSLVEALGAAMAKTEPRPTCFLQVNVGEEEQKGGCRPRDLPGLVDQARKAGLPAAGLMAIPPAVAEPAPYFALLATLSRRSGLSGLSMGMSADFETAIMCGATHVRIGTALFGERREQ
jgi:pyridoxal phosphate enzyme (YggS family)